MSQSNRFAIGAVLCALCVCLSSARAAEPAVTLDVWPGAAPLEKGIAGTEHFLDKNPNDKKGVARLTDVSKPTLSVYRPDKAKDTGASVIICPGGGYSILAWDLEGTEVADWLNSIGVTGIILKYRVPTRHGDPTHQIPLSDAQRAVSLVRSKAGEWGLDPNRIGILGFSAGGNLTALTCTHFDQRAYEAVDDADKASCRPDFGVLVYPAWLVADAKKPAKTAAADGKTAPVDATPTTTPAQDKLLPEFPVDGRTPPMFMAHASDDGITAANSAAMYLALKRAGVPAELHIFSSGGHGFGLRPTEKPCSAWPQRCEAWMKVQGILSPATK